MNDDYPNNGLPADDDYPRIFIERDDEAVSAPPSRKRRHLSLTLQIVLAAALIAGAFAAYRAWAYFFRLGLPISATPAENIDKLKSARPSGEVPQVVMSSDSVLGVALDFYALHGLKASLEMREPDTADVSVYLYCRSADHTPDIVYEGTLVVQGNELQVDRSRLGYMAMVGDGMVIGVSRSDKVKDYVVEHGGSFFRQYVMLSKGKVPTNFRLHGKIERRAIGRIGDQLYFIATRHKETMWDFADALREYGFVDAIYITGGAEDYNYYRTADGQRHDILPIEQYPHAKWPGIVPWLVFRKAGH